MLRQERCSFLFFNSNVNRFSSGLEACLQFKGLLDCFSFRRKLCNQMLSSDGKGVVAHGKFLLLGEKPPNSLSMTCLDLKQLPSSDFSYHKLVLKKKKNIYVYLEQNVTLKWKSKTFFLFPEMSCRNLWLSFGFFPLRNMKGFRCEIFGITENIIPAEF